ncbi:MAG TPA: Crp/Fnr family transcriptional regulator [Porticoccaceae bacterium]|nr:Crp/Fnr family transcriptional regulator [Porticoccaceae bacterium]HIG67838.1 Crp/Fnr family transcriptional regulator [Porticoccaceae bacterium]HIK80832.1 Crp/Fnr family transcriptional regulator [Porticoccaceae bacterium]
MGKSNKIALADNEWLAALPEAARLELVKAAKIRRFGADVCVQRKGETADGLYGLLKGEVRVFANTFAGDEIVFTHILPGQWFGEIAILDGGLRTHDAHTTMPSELVILPRQVILELCERHLEVYQALVSLLCTHCRLAFGAVDEFLVCSPEQRMAKRLLQRTTFGTSGKITISQKELGALAGISRQSTNKILKRWESQVWIKRVYGGIEIYDYDALQHLP